MNDFEKITVLENEIEAKLLEGLLKEQGIPHLIRGYHDSAYDGLFQFSQGWGHIEAPNEFKEEILSILHDLRRQKKRK